MTELDDAMKELAFIVLSQHRSFSYLDFMHFEVGGREYTMTSGTFRNKVSSLRKSGEVELAYRSVIAFYTLKCPQVWQADDTYPYGGLTYRIIRG